MNMLLFKASITNIRLIEMEKYFIVEEVNLNTSHVEVNPKQNSYFLIPMISSNLLIINFRTKIYQPSNKFEVNLKNFSQSFLFTRLQEYQFILRLAKMDFYGTILITTSMHYCNSRNINVFQVA